MHQETAELQPKPEALHGGKRELGSLQDTGEVHIRLQFLLLATVLLQWSAAAARQRRFYGNVTETERRWETGMARNGNCLHCPCQAYAGYFFVARALLINSTSEMEEFTSYVRQFCQTHWKVVCSCQISHRHGG